MYALADAYDGRPIGRSERAKSSSGHRAGFPYLADRDAVELLAAAVDQVDDTARDEHGGEHRGHDAQAVDDREATHGSRAENEKSDAGDQRRHVRVENRAECALVA